MVAAGSAGGERGRVAAWMRLARVYHQTDRATAEVVRAWDLSVAQFDVLAQVGAREGLTQQELADRLLVTKGNISQLIAKMARRGLVRRHREGRSICLFLTHEGRRVRDAAVPAQEAMVAARFGALAAGEVRELTAMLRRIERGAG